MNATPEPTSTPPAGALEKPMPARGARAEWLLLAAALAVAAALRLPGLSAGLRQAPMTDERYFVENTASMLRRGDLDHRFYEYPGLFFYLLAPALAAAGAGAASGDPAPAAYLAARVLVACFGVANVGLLYRLGRRLAGRWTALAAAALLAVSPVDVETSRVARADVVLEAFALIALARLLGLGPRLGGDLKAGLAVGAAAAVKFTGALLAPSYLAARLLAPGPRLRGLALAGAAGLAVVLALTPYAVIHAPEFAEGVRTQLSYHYQDHGAAPPPVPVVLVAHAAVWLKALGAPGCLLAAAGLGLVRREWRRWLPLLLFPLATVAVFATQSTRFDRQMVPSFGVVALLAGAALERLSRRSRPAALAAAAVAVAVPLAASVALVQAVRAPSTRDAAALWIASRLPAGARVLTTVPALGLEGYEVMEVEPGAPGFASWALHADVVVTGEGDPEPEPLPRLAVAFTASPESRFSGRALLIRPVPAALRPAYTAVPLARARLRASGGADLLAALCDGRLDTFWQTSKQADQDEWLEVELAEPVRLGRVELLLGDRVELAGRGLSVAVSRDGVRWNHVPALPGRPHVRRQPATAGPPSQVLLLLRPMAVRAVRILQHGGGERPWGAAELRLGMLREAP